MADRADGIMMGNILRSWIGRYHDGHERAGQFIERRKVCACGRAFTQMQLSEPFLAALERRRPEVIAAFQRQLGPDLYVPVHCPPCERVDIRNQARIDEARAVGTASPTYPDDRRSA